MREMMAEKRVTMFLEILQEMADISYSDFLVALIFLDKGIKIDKDFAYNYEGAILCSLLWEHEAGNEYALHPDLVMFKKASDLTPEERIENGI